MGYFQYLFILLIKQGKDKKICKNYGFYDIQVRKDKIFNIYYEYEYDRKFINIQQSQKPHLEQSAMHNKLNEQIEQPQQNKKHEQKLAQNGGNVHRYEDHELDDKYQKQIKQIKSKSELHKKSREQLDDFFIDKSSRKKDEHQFKKKQRKPNQSNQNVQQLFQKCDSVYEDEQITNKQNNKGINNNLRQFQDNPNNINPYANNTNTQQQQAHPNQIKDKYMQQQAQQQNDSPIKYYTRCINTAKQYLKILNKSYYLCVFRMILIVFVYYNVDFLIPKPVRNPDPLSPNTTYAQPNTNTTTNTTNYGDKEQSKAQGLYQPWNVMIYFLSGSIDMISIIGYISSKRFLKSEIKILESRCKLQEQMAQQEERRHRRQRRIQRQERQRSQGSQRQRQPNNQMQEQCYLNNHQIQIQPSQLQIPQIPPGVAMIMNQRARTVRIGKQSTYLSLYSTIRQYKYKNRDQAAAYKISKIMHITATFLFFGRMALIQQYQAEQKLADVGSFQGPWKEIILWFFLTSAYIVSFQLDFLLLQSSTGPYIKVKKFHYSKIYEIYQKFNDWRNKYSRFLIAGLAIAMFSLVFEIITGFVNEDESILSALFFMKIFIIASGFLSFRTNSSILEKSKNYIEDQKNNYESNKPTLNENKKFSQGNLQKMLIYKNLSLLGILNKHTHQYQYLYIIMHRIVIFLYLLSILRQSDLDRINIIVFLVFFAGEYFKLNTFMNSQMNLLNSCKYQYVRASKNKDESISISMNEQKSTQLKQISEQALKKLQNLNQIKSLDSLRSHDKKSKEQSSFNSSNSSCSVCLNEYEQQQNVIILCCGHIFHEVCLLDWLKQKKQCPLCRLNIEQYYEEISF